MMEQALQRGGGKVKRQRQFLPHHGNGCVHICRTTQNARQQIYIFKGGSVAPIGRLVICCAVDVIENWAWQAALRQSAKIVKVVAIGQAHRLSFRGLARERLFIARIDIDDITRRLCR